MFDYQLLDLLQHFFSILSKVQTELNGHFFFAEEDFVKVTLNFGLHSGIFPVPANPDEDSWKHSILLATSERVVKHYLGHGSFEVKVFGLKFLHCEEVDFEVNQRILESSSCRVDSDTFRGFERIFKPSKRTSDIPTLPAFYPKDGTRPYLSYKYKPVWEMCGQIAGLESSTEYFFK